jgi:DUF971 family protein
MDVGASGLFSWHYLDELDKQLTELHRCSERARQQSADAIDHAVRLLLDAADAHKQAAAAYELAGSTEPSADLQAQASRHRQAAAARRAAAASLASRVPGGCDSDDLRLQALLPDRGPLDMPGEIEDPRAGCDVVPTGTRRA